MHSSWVHTVSHSLRGRVQGVLNPKVTRCPGWVSSNYVYSDHVGCFRPSSGIAHASGLCARQAAMFCLAALWAEGMPAIIRTEHLLGSLLLTQPHIPCGSWGTTQETTGLEPIWSHNK